MFVLTVYPPRLQFHEHTQCILAHEWFSALPHLERAYLNGESMSSDELLCWTRGDALEPRRTHMEEVYEIYRTKYALETALLKPFSDISRFKHEEHSPIGREKMNGQKDLGLSFGWWKQLLNWDIISFVRVSHCLASILELIDDIV